MLVYCNCLTQELPTYWLETKEFNVLTVTEIKGLCLGYGDKEKNDKLPRPLLSAWPSSVAKPKSNVTLRCCTHSQNITATLGKSHTLEYKREQSSVGNEAEFHLTDLQPEDAGGYFCAYRTAASHEWSGQSHNLQLVITGSLQEPSLSVKATSMMTGHRILQCLIPNNGSECFIIALLKTGISEPLQTKKERNNRTDFMLWNVTSKDSGNYSCVHYQCKWPHLGSSPSRSLEIWVTGEPTASRTPLLKTDGVGLGEGNVPKPAGSRPILLTTFSCLCISLLFVSVFLIYRCTRHSSSHEESPKRTTHSKFPRQEHDTTDSYKEESSSLSTEEPPGVTHAELNIHVSSEVAFVPTEEPSKSCDYAVLEV